MIDEYNSSTFAKFFIGPAAILGLKFGAFLCDVGAKILNWFTGLFSKPEEQ